MRRKTRKHNFKSGKIKWNKTFRINNNQPNKSKKNTKKQHGSAPLDKNGKLKKVNCSPKDKSEMNNFTCYTDKSLYKLRDLWNARHPDQKITSSNTKEIHSLLTKYLSHACNKESCWIKQKDEFGKLDEKLSDSFAPESPGEWKKNPNEWLTSVDITNVMKQYEKAYKCFDFIGPSPIDFDYKKMYGECVWEELCNFSLAEQIKKKKNKIGIIFNTDPHNKPGQHWISMFINIRKASIFFFDSTGDPAPKEIMTFVERIKAQGRKLNPKLNFKFDSNEGTEHQYGNTECGIYSLFFIVHMLEDKLTDHYIKTHILKDEYMEKFRKIYFNDSLL
jgi:hypothetical protein